MDTAYSSEARAERLIAAGRVVLAGSSLFAVWYDPSEPAKHAGIAYGLLVGYLAYALTVAALIFRSESPPRAQRLVTHVFDLTFFSVFMYFTAGPSSPFNTYFVFSLVCGTLRWQWKGALWTASVALATFVGLGVYFAEVLRDPAFEFTPFLTRAVYLAVVAVMLGYLGAHEEQARREIGLLAAWPESEPTTLEDLARGVLAYGRDVVGSPRALLIWSEREEPWLRWAVLQPAGFESGQREPGAYDPLVAEPLSGNTFVSYDLRQAAPKVLIRDGAAITRWYGRPLHAELVQRFGIRTVLGVPLRGQTFDGWLLAVDKPRVTADDLALGSVLGSVVTARLDRHNLAQSLRDAAATEERIRLSRDLHDGVLQSLTGIALRLAAVQRQMAEDPGAAREALEAARRLITLEQQDLRFLIDELKPTASLTSTREATRVGDRLKELASRAEHEWNLRVELRTADIPEPLPEGLAREVYLIVREALVNAVRHGSASRVQVSMAIAEGRLRLRVADDGRGFPFHGRYSAAQLAAEDLGPRTLRERIAALRGSLVLESGPSGAHLEIELPQAAVRG